MKDNLPEEVLASLVSKFTREKKKKSDKHKAMFSRESQKFVVNERIILVKLFYSFLKNYSAVSNI